MSTLKVDTVQGSTGTTVTVPAGHVMHFAEPPTGAGFAGAVTNSLDGATTGDTSSTSVVVDVPHTIARNIATTEDPDYVPFVTVSTRLTFTNGILTRCQGGIGRFLKYVNRSYNNGWFGILATGSSQPFSNVDPFDFGQFYMANNVDNGLAGWIYMAGSGETSINGVAKSPNPWIYVTGSSDAAQEGVWMYAENTGWFWWSAATVKQPTSGTIGGIWVYVKTQVGSQDLGWHFWYTEASTESTSGGIGGWAWSHRYQKWFDMSDEDLTLVAQVGGGEDEDSGAVIPDSAAEPNNSVPVADVDDDPEDH